MLASEPQSIHFILSFKILYLRLTREDLSRFYSSIGSNIGSFPLLSTTAHDIKGLGKFLP
jgi:hypothetical protein